MKKLLTIFSLVLLSSCSNEVNEVPSHRLIENGGMTYEIGSNNPFTGVSVNYENGQLKEKVNFKNGKEVSKTSFKYHENGQLRIQHEDKTEVDEDGRTNRVVTQLLFFYHENGQLRLEQTQIAPMDEPGTSNQVITVINKCFHSNGQVCSDDGTFFDMDGEPISMARWKELYIDLWSTD